MGLVVETGVFHAHGRAVARHGEALQLQPVFRQHTLQNGLDRITPAPGSRVVPLSNRQTVARADGARGLLQPAGYRRFLGVDDIAQLRADLMPPDDKPLEVHTVLETILQPHVEGRRHVDARVHRFPRIFIGGVFGK